MEVLKLIASCLTPILVIVLGLIISRKLERNRIGILKEKEWQVRWADLFLAQAIEFNRNISIIVCSLSGLQHLRNKTEIDQEVNRITASMNIILNIDWEIQNFAQFATLNKSIVLEKQRLLIDKIRAVINERKGDLEEIRKVQFDYNQAIRKAHNEILNAV